MDAGFAHTSLWWRASCLLPANRHRARASRRRHGARTASTGAYWACLQGCKVKSTNLQHLETVSCHCCNQNETVNISHSFQPFLCWFPVRQGWFSQLLITFNRFTTRGLVSVKLGHRNILLAWRNRDLVWFLFFYEGWMHNDANALVLQRTPVLCFCQSWTEWNTNQGYPQRSYFGGGTTGNLYNSSHGES